MCCNECIQLSVKSQLPIAVETSDYTIKATILVFSEQQYLKYLYEKKKGSCTWSKFDDVLLMRSCCSRTSSFGNTFLKWEKRASSSYCLFAVCTGDGRAIQLHWENIIYIYINLFPRIVALLVLEGIYFTFSVI